MPSCIACGATFAPPMRAPNTQFPKTLYRIGGEHYCRHHVIRAAVAASLIIEVKPGDDRRPGGHPAEDHQSVQG